MDAGSQLKVIRAGFTIIRYDDQPNLRIKFKDGEHLNWTTFRTFPTKAERDRIKVELLCNVRFIED